MSKQVLKAQRAKLQAELRGLDRKIKEHDEVDSGDRPAPAIAALIKSQGFSFGVAFIRRKANRRGEAVKVSTRRFSSVKEANQHGKRFTRKHGHKDFLVTYVQARANAWVNWKTGKTNPVIG